LRSRAISGAALSAVFLILCAAICAGVAGIAAVFGLALYGP